MYKIKDRLLHYLTKRSPIDYIFEELREELYFPLSEKDCIVMLKELEELGYINVNRIMSKINFLKLTPKGKDFIVSGGFTNQLKQQKQETYDKMDMKLMRWKVRVFWLTQTLIVISLALSIIAFLRTL